MLENIVDQRPERGVVAERLADPEPAFEGVAARTLVIGGRLAGRQSQFRIDESIVSSPRPRPANSAAGLSPGFGRSARTLTAARRDA